MDWSPLKSLFSLLVLPPSGPLLLAVAGYVLMTRRYGMLARLGRVLLATGLAATWLISTPVVTEALIGWIEAGGPPPLTAEALDNELRGGSPPGAIVVLGSGVRHNAREWPHAEWPNPRTLERLAFGALLARSSGLPILVAGGTPRQREESEAVLMARTLKQSFGLEARWLEDGSGNTAANARETAKVLGADGIKRVVLVTQAYHMPRSLAVFRAAGLDVIAAPHGYLGGSGVSGWRDFFPSAGAVSVGWLALYEAFGTLWYGLRGEL